MPEDGSCDPKSRLANIVSLSGLPRNIVSIPDIHISTIMSAAKRPASNSFGSSQLVVKRQKSNVDISNGRAVATISQGSGAGPLVYAVSPFCRYPSCSEDCAER